MSALNFTKQSILRLPRPLRGMKTYKDTNEKGLSLYVTSNGVITFFIRKRIHGRDERVILGNFPEMSVEGARKEALKRKAEIAAGSNPNHDKKKIRLEVTFRELFSEYMERYSKVHKKSWKYDEREVDKFLSHWSNRKISSISKYEIQSLHEKIGRENGIYQANRILERIRAIFNRGIEWGWEGKNPTQGIRKYKEKSRDRFIQPDELPRFFRALDGEPNEIARDYIWISLLTGARKSNVLMMRWEQINWQREEWRIPETKNGEPITIPLSAKAIEILKIRKNKNDGKEWVFYSGGSRQGHLADPKKAWARILKEAQIENLRIHDIRRTLGSYQAITGASLQIIGKSLGHKSQAATQVYARLNLDPVRDSIEKATQAMFAIYDGKPL